MTKYHKYFKKPPIFSSWVIRLNVCTVVFDQSEASKVEVEFYNNESLSSELSIDLNLHPERSHLQLRLICLTPATVQYFKNL